MRLIPEEHFDLRSAAISCHPTLHLSLPASEKGADVKTGAHQRTRKSERVQQNQAHQWRLSHEAVHRKMRGNPLELQDGPTNRNSGRDSQTSNLAAACTEPARRVHRRGLNDLYRDPWDRKGKNPTDRAEHRSPQTLAEQRITPPPPIPLATIDRSSEKGQASWGTSGPRVSPCGARGAGRRGEAGRGGGGERAEREEGDEDWRRRRRWASVGHSTSGLYIMLRAERGRY